MTNSEFAKAALDFRVAGQDLLNSGKLTTTEAAAIRGGMRAAQLAYQGKAVKTVYDARERQLPTGDRDD